MGNGGIQIPNGITSCKIRDRVVFVPELAGFKIKLSTILGIF